MRQPSAHPCLKFVADFVLCCVWNWYLIFCSSNRQTALHAAVHNAHTQVCQLLIEAKADVNNRNMCAFVFEMCCCFCNVLFFFEICF
jgi:hypothetical protein